MFRVDREMVFFHGEREVVDDSKKTLLDAMMDEESIKE